MNRFQFVADHQRRYGVKRLCTILRIARSSFYYWHATAMDRAARREADALLATRIRAVHQESDGTYGVPRITAELRDDGERVNHKRVARLMRSMNLEGLRLRRRHRTTIPVPAVAKAPDPIGRDFTATAVNTKYVGDITYLPLDGGKFCYLATDIDLASRRLAGWAIADHMRTELVTDALAAAKRTRGSLTGAITHTDHGSQYKSRAFTEACRSTGVRQSMGAIGSSADNALAESFNTTFKRETLQGRKNWPNEREAPPRRLPMAPPLQHPTTTLPPRTPQPHRLRDNHRSNNNYADPSRITRAQDSGSSPPGRHTTPPESMTVRQTHPAGRPAAADSLLRPSYW